MCNGTKVPCSVSALSKGELWCARDASRLKAVQHDALLRRAFAGEGAHDTSAGSLDSCLSRKLDAQTLGMTEGSGKGLRRAALARTAECGCPHKGLGAASGAAVLTKDSAALAGRLSPHNSSEAGGRTHALPGAPPSRKAGPSLRSG